MLEDNNVAHGHKRLIITVKYIKVNFGKEVTYIQMYVCIVRGVGGPNHCEVSLISTRITMLCLGFGAGLN